MSFPPFGVEMSSVILEGIFDDMLEEAMHHAMQQTASGDIHSTTGGLTPNDAMIDPSTTTTPTEINSNDDKMTRNEQILMLQSQLDDLRERHAAVQSSWEQDFWVTALRELGSYAWHDLPRSKRRLRPNVKALLQSKSHLPFCDRQFWTLQLPSELQDDRELLLLRLARPEFRAWHHEDAFQLPKQFWHDKEIIMAAVKAYPEILDQQGVVGEAFLRDADVFRALFEATRMAPSWGSADARRKYLKSFALELRQDASLMLEALRKGISIFETLPNSLKNNQDFALRAATILGELNADNTIFFVGGRQRRRLKHFSPRLRACREVVEAFCRHDNGWNLIHASYKLRRNRETIVTACRENPNALQCALKGGTRTQLRQDVSFWLDILRGQHGEDFCLDATLYRMIPDVLWQNEDLVRAVIALMEEESDDVFLTPIWKETRYWLDLAKRNNLVRIFREHKEQEERMTKEICLQVLQLPYLEVEMINIIARQLKGDDFFSNPEYWRAINPDQDSDVWSELAPSLLGSPVLQDKNIVLHLFTDTCALNAVIVGVDAALLMDRDVFDAALAADPDSLAVFPSSMQLLHPELIVRCIEDDCDYEELHENIDEDLWDNSREVFLAWIKHSDDDELYEFDNVLERYAHDEEVMLAVAENAFDCLVSVADLALMSDKSFLCKACAVQGRVWTLIDDPDLKHDFDVALSAFGSSPDLPYDAVGENFSFLVKFARTVRNHLQEYDKFVKYILGSIDAAVGDDDSNKKDDDKCPLELLSQGKETALVYKKRLAEYVGIPVGEKLRLLRSASENLAKWGF